jgi:acyl-CoA thioester hydrolase
MTDYETEVSIQVRYRDIDTEKHVNNAVYVTYLEQARVEYIQEVFGAEPLDPGFVVVTVTVDYERPIEFGEDVLVGLGVTDIGTASIEMGYDLRADGERAATAETVIVPFDRENGTSEPVPDAWRERIAAHEGRNFE